MYNGLRSSTVDHQTLQIVIFFVFNLLCTVSCISNNGTCNFTNDFCDYVQTKSNSELYWHRSNASYIASPQMLKEQFVRLTSPTISIEKGHCVTFSYRIRPGKLFTHPNIDTNNSKLVQNADIQLKVFVLHESNSETFHQEVWTNPIGQSKNWKQVEIALSPSSYKLMFEVSGLGNGLSGLVVDINNIELSKNLCDVTPLFLKLGSKEANIGENITMECLLSVDYNFNTSLDQISVSLEKAEFSPNKKPSKIRSDGYHYFFDFQFDNLNFHTKGSYRCVYKSTQVVAISNSADIIVSIPPVPTTAPQILQLGPDSVELNLNNNQYSGDGPLVRSYLHYRRKGLNWFQSHEMKGRTYQLWHLTPDTTYIFAVSLERPGIGGRGTMGPELELKTKCMSPSRPVSHVTTSSPTYDSVQVKWQQLDFSEINCHAFKYKLKYRQQFIDIKNKSEKFKSIDANLDGDAFIKSLLPYTTYEIRIVTINEAGQIESTSFYQRTQESVPGPIPKDTFQVTNVDETSISLRWEKPEKENGFLRNYQISYQATSSHDPSFNVKYEKAHIERSFPDRSINLTSLKPGTTHNITICAETLVGCGPIVSLQVDTHIAPPTMPQYPPLNNKTNQTNPTVEVILRPAYSNGAPVTNYYLVIEDITDEMEENSRRRRSVLASKITTTESEMNEAGSTAPSGGDKSTCVNISPLDYKQAKAMNKSSFVAASFSPEQLNKERKFVVGDGSKHNGFTNIALNPKRNYRIYLVAESKVGDEVRSGCVVLLQTDAVVAKDTSAETNTESEKSTGGTAFVLYGGIGGAILVIVLISVVLLVLIRAHRKKKNPQKDEVVNPFEVRLMLSDIPQNVSSNNSHLMNSTLPIQSSYNSNVAGYRDPDFNEKNMEATCASSVGDAENEKFAIRVNDFHLHVSQMKSADGYGFREEFSLFPEGPTASWNVALSSINKKKNRYGNIMAYDHSRVVLEPVPGFDTALTTNYINASYINGYKCPPSYIATQAPTSDTCVDFWLMVWQENVNVVVMLTNLMELGKRKCEKYWPDDRGQYGPFEVSMNREEFTCDYVMRTFLLRQVGEYDVREVRQFHFSAWPDHGVPSRPTNLLTFIRRVKAFEPPDGSTIVHCSAGSGRTGCYITIDQMLQMAREEEIVDVYNTVRHLRTKRVDMVQTEVVDHLTTTFFPLITSYISCSIFLSTKLSSKH